MPDEPLVRPYCWDLKDVWIEDFRFLAELDKSYAGVAEKMEELKSNDFCGVPRHGLGRWFRKELPQITG